METRNIYYIEENLDYIDEEVQLALTRTNKENLRLYCEAVIMNYAMMDIDVVSHPVKREIQFIEDE